MLTIYKYSLSSFPEKYELPIGAKFLCVQTQHNEPQMWFEVDTSVLFETRCFTTYGTGQFIKTPAEKRQYLGTFQLNGGSLVFHLFEVLL